MLGKTLGVPLFQEQAMQIAIVGGGLHARRGRPLRRAMATFRHVGTIHTFREKFIAGMVGNGYEREFAERCFSQIEGFGEYGFPESHAASFALLVYVSSWIKRHYPDAFCAALLNSQPMGFYQPAQLVRDAREHGVEVRHPDINCSDWDCTLEHRCPMRDRQAASDRVCCRVGSGLRARPIAVRARLRRAASARDRSSQRAGRAMPTCRRCGCAAARRSACWSGSPMPTPSAPSGSTAAQRCGR